MQPKYDSALAANQRTPLRTPLQIGDLTVTAEKVRWTEGGDLQLFLRARNESKNTRFTPISDVFAKYVPNKAGNELYTFLESKSKNTSPVYGAYVEYYKNFTKLEHALDNVIGPKEEAYIVLLTTPNFRTPNLAAIAKATDDFVWRVQVRRGFVEKKGGKVSATAVVGFEFSSADIEKS